MRRADHPRLQAALLEVEDSIDDAWSRLCDEVGTTDERGLAETVLQDPAEFDWRVVDGALARLTCVECGSSLGAGPVRCTKCDLANGFRFAARQLDHPNVAPGNEHALRASSAVAHPRDRYSPRARCGDELLLPELLAGELPTTAEAQRTKALINQLSDDLLEHLITIDQLLHRKDRHG